jgi:hypothetical protein
MWTGRQADKGHPELVYRQGRQAGQILCGCRKVGTGNPAVQQTGKESVWADERHASELLEIWGQRHAVSRKRSDLDR